MSTRGLQRTPCALLTLVFVLAAVTLAGAWDQKFRFPMKVRVPKASVTDMGIGGIGVASSSVSSDWHSAAGAPAAEILCPKRGYDFALGMRPFFSTLTGSVKAASTGGEGTFLNLHGHLRLPSERTQWELYGHLKLWDKVSVMMEYLPWSWSGPGHMGVDGNFAGLLIKRDTPIMTTLDLTTFRVSADYDVSFGKDLCFGPNGEFNVIKWNQRVVTGDGDSGDFAKTILQPAIGAHVRYDPKNTGYFSWFKPYMEGRFSWMNLDGLGYSIMDLGAGVAPPVSRNVDGGVKLGYKTWRLDGTRKRILTDVGVEGMYMDFSLRF